MWKTNLTTVDTHLGSRRACALTRTEYGPRQGICESTRDMRVAAR